MHPAHEEFVSRPSFCRLDYLFGLLNEYDVAERHRILGPLYQEFFRSTSIDFPLGTSEEDGMLIVYQRFKAALMALSEAVPYAFIVMGVVSTTLAWLHGSSDERLISRFLEGNRRSIEMERQRFARGEISQQDLDQVMGEIEERINNLRADMNLRRGQYERFCEQVVARMPDGKPTE
jgi:hypothetical protein